MMRFSVEGMKVFLFVERIILVLCVFLLLACNVVSVDWSNEGSQLLSVCKGIAKLMQTELVGPTQFSNQVVYLSGGLPQNPIFPPLIDATGINMSSTTIDIMRGLYVPTSFNIVGVSLTLSSGSYVGFNRGKTGLLETTVRSTNSTCKTSGVGLGHKPYELYEVERVCDPVNWITYTSALQKSYGAFATPALGDSFESTTTFGQMAVLPYSIALKNVATGEVEGVVTTNLTLSSILDLFEFPNTVYYVMTTKSTKFLLVSNSVGEELNAGGSLFPAYTAKNTVIRKSAQFLASQVSIPSRGAYYAVTGENNATLLIAVTQCTDYARTLIMWVVTVTYVPQALGQDSTNDTCVDSDTQQSSLVGPTLSAEILSVGAGVLLEQAITFGESIAFLAGSGAPLPMVPYPVLLNDTTPASRQILRGMMNAYGFPLGFDNVFECALVDDRSGAYTGYTITNTMFTMNASCPQLVSGEGITYPAIDSDCFLVYFSDTYGEPMEPAYKQMKYDARNETWYQRVKSTGLTSTYGAFPEPTFGLQGIGIAVPVYDDASQFIGAVEVFMQTIILTESTAADGVNVSFLMTADDDLIGTSESPIATLIYENSPINAVNYSNPIVAAAASYIVENAINFKNVFFYPFSNTLSMQIAISRAQISTRSAINWMVVSVRMFSTVRDTPVIPAEMDDDVGGGDGGDDGDDGGDINGGGGGDGGGDSPSSLEVMAVVLGSMGLVGFVVVIAAVAVWWWRYRQPASPPSSDPNPAPTLELELGSVPSVETSNPIVSAVATSNTK